MQTITLPTTGTYAIDPTHSNVEITARHMMVTKVRGNFEGVTGSIHVGSRPEESAVEVEFDAASIDTRVAELIGSKAGLAARALDAEVEAGDGGFDLQLEALLGLLTAALEKREATTPF